MNRARSLRFRLTALNLLVFGLLQGGVLLSLFLASSAWLRLDFDEWLRARAEELRPHMSPSPSTQRLSDAVRFEGMIIQLTTADGRVLYRSEQSTYYLPETRSPAGGKEFETLPPAREGDSPYRLYSTPHQDEAGEPMLLQVGASLDRLQSTLKTQRTILILVFPLSLLLVALASWLLVGQALAPLSKIIREAPTIDAAHLDRRLPAPGAPRELQELVVSLNGMLDRLQHGFRAQERFLAEASHELRTPIAVLLGEAQVLAKQPRDERTYQEYLALAESELQRLSRTLDSLLILARANAGHAVRLAERVSINEVVLTAVQRQMAASDVPIDVRLTEDADPIVLGDEPLLVTCVSNLLSNAQRHSPKAASVRLTVSLEPALARVRVADEGPGVAPEDRESLFEPFAQRHSEHPGQAGLGLAIARAIAELHGGELKLETTAPEGAVFCLDLPLS